MKKSHKGFSASKPIFFSKVFLQFGQLKGKLGQKSNFVELGSLDASQHKHIWRTQPIWAGAMHFPPYCAAHFTGISARRRALMTHLDQAEEGVVLHTTLPKVFAGLP